MTESRQSNPGDKPPQAEDFGLTPETLSHLRKSNSRRKAWEIVLKVVYTCVLLASWFFLWKQLRLSGFVFFLVLWVAYFWVYLEVDPILRTGKGRGLGVACSRCTSSTAVVERRSVWAVGAGIASGTLSKPLWASGPFRSSTTAAASIAPFPARGFTRFARRKKRRTRMPQMR